MVDKLIPGNSVNCMKCDERKYLLYLPGIGLQIHFKEVKAACTARCGGFQNYCHQKIQEGIFYEKLL